MLLTRRTSARAASEVQFGAQEISEGNTNLSQRTRGTAAAEYRGDRRIDGRNDVDCKKNADNAAQANELASAACVQAAKRQGWS